ncbi:hypothetical protein BDK51DRAFT_49247 [Blyttiomyces helicus]|uniref:Uncharacterized protein n=1 Tax=Blyttiomyces helicus TaxID=388810 RepID=A0A4P9W128_9FUNG|nr:hypothetical protein BDK51DRAFT_49247 [Blyttiomyces helicus]|eukprot:RKO84270.1 hypothetical protein BDK51DRAFT_49247 [Blyttiomyces helicus]
MALACSLAVRPLPPPSQKVPENAVENAIRLLYDVLCNVTFSPPALPLPPSLHPEDVRDPLPCTGPPFMLSSYNTPTPPPSAKPSALPGPQPDGHIASVLEKRSTRERRNAPTQTEHHTRDVKPATPTIAPSIATPPKSTRQAGGPTSAPELFEVTLKAPRTLHAQAVLAVWDRARSRRWRAWYDGQMESAHEQARVGQDRRASWFQSRSCMRDQPRFERGRSAFVGKLRTMPAPAPAPTLEAEHGRAEEGKAVADRESCVALGICAPFGEGDQVARRVSEVAGFESRTIDEHRARVIAEDHVGKLERVPIDYWSQWSARETLEEQRRMIRDHLSSTPVDQWTPRINAKRLWLSDSRAW